MLRQVEKLFYEEQVRKAGTIIWSGEAGGDMIQVFKIV